MDLAAIIPMKIEFKQVRLLKVVACDRIYAVFFEKGNDAHYVKDHTVVPETRLTQIWLDLFADFLNCTIGFLSFSQRHSAAVEWQFLHLLVSIQPYLLVFLSLASPISNHLLVRDEQSVLRVSFLAHSIC